MSRDSISTPTGYAGPDRRRSETQALVEHEHPGTGAYWGIAAILTILTLLEVGIFYVPAFSAVMAPLLILMSVTKMVLVVGFYMHLKNDANIFSVIFLLPFFLAMFLGLGLMFLFGAWWF
jgi:caa(3)-type oxidase subunit IV